LFLPIVKPPCCVAGIGRRVAGDGPKLIAAPTDADHTVRARGDRAAIADVSFIYTLSLSRGFRSFIQGARRS
jgi:hypothetical protein